MNGALLKPIVFMALIICSSPSFGWERHEGHFEHGGHFEHRHRDFDRRGSLFFDFGFPVSYYDYGYPYAYPYYYPAPYNYPDYSMAPQGVYVNGNSYNAGPSSAPQPQIYQVPTTGSSTAPDDITINIPNDKGGYSAVSLKKSGTGYVGPQGEFYTEFPTVAQLRLLYGK
jgi:hypothetical protein